ncbi:MAG TPA: NAD(P)H:quinone oxidoreductase type IV [Paracoccaceae bacterium]|nr:NAD(P)H:quinone oxidoreductase type IV [Paracoccaceae bacterium]
MVRILVLYYSSYGHMEIMANEAAEGIRASGAEAVVKRVPELVPEEVARNSGYKMDQQAPIATVDELAGYDGFLFGVPTRYGNMSSQMKNFLDQTGGLWASGALIDKVASVMSSTATQHGGQEMTIVTTQVVLQHHGMLIMPLSYAYEGQSGSDKVRGGSPYGMTLVTNSDGSRWPDEDDLAGARFQGERLGRITAKLHG